MQMKLGELNPVWTYMIFQTIGQIIYNRCDILVISGKSVYEGVDAGGQAIPEAHFESLKGF